MKETCLDCSGYMPVSEGQPTEYGICLNDEAFEPFVDDLMSMRFDGCRALVEEKKFVGGDQPACSEFDESEIMEIDDDSPLAENIRGLSERGELTFETLEAAVLEEEIRRINPETLPVDQYGEQLQGGAPAERDKAVTSLGGLAALGNKAAFEVLFNFLRELPLPQTIAEVHWKMDILRHLALSREGKAILARYLLEELRCLPSNNTTRQWITAILEFLAQCPRKVIEGPLNEMLSEKKSPKLKTKIKEALWRSQELSSRETKWSR